MYVLEFMNDCEKIAFDSEFMARDYALKRYAEWLEDYLIRQFDSNDEYRERYQQRMRKAVHEVVYENSIEDGDFAIIYRIEHRALTHEDTMLYERYGVATDWMKEANKRFMKGDF